MSQTISKAVCVWVTSSRIARGLAAGTWRYELTQDLDEDNTNFVLVRGGCERTDCPVVLVKVKDYKMWEEVTK